MNLTQLESWFRNSVSGSSPPLSIATISGGRSNLTYEITDRSGQRWVLRRPPSHGRIGSAHDVIREFSIISALQGHGVPVPETICACEDESVVGAPFYVMRFVDGLVLRTASDAERLSPQVRHAVSKNTVHALASIHGVDVDRTQLRKFGKPDGYLERQLRTWHRQWTKLHTFDNGLVDALFDRLLQRVPREASSTLVHGDFRIDNLIVGPQGEVRAVLDWELSTLGDPLADLGMLLVYWRESDDLLQPLPSPPTSVRGFLTRRAILELYADITGRSVDDMAIYIAFGYWKLAVILEGVSARRQQGAYAGMNVEDFTENVQRLLEASSEVLSQS